MSYSGLGNCYLKMGDYARSLRAYERSLIYDPSNKFAYNGMGVAYENADKDEQALKNFNKAIELDPNFVYPYNGLGNMYYARKKYSEALPYYESAYRLAPNNALVLANLACCQAALGQTDDAQDNFRKAQNAAAMEQATMSASNQFYLSQKLREFNALISGQSDTTTVRSKYLATTQHSVTAI